MQDRGEVRIRDIKYRYEMVVDEANVARRNRSSATLSQSKPPALVICKKFLDAGPYNLGRSHA